MRYSVPMLEQYNKYNSTHNVSVSDKDSIQQNMNRQL